MIKDIINEELKRIINGETDVVVFAAEGCSLNYLRNVVHSSTIGNFATSIIKNTNQIKVFLRPERGLKVIGMDEIVQPPEDDLHWDLLVPNGNAKGNTNEKGNENGKGNENTRNNEDEEDFLGL
jgi:hypothetical protein